jgi:L-fuculose-phosphate aldolase
MDSQALRRDIVKYCQRIWERGWVANHDGNLTVRLDKNRILATPTAFSKKEIREDDILVVELWTGKVANGRHKAFSELPLHLEYYKVREDVNAVLHAHPPVASAFSVAGIEVETRITPEAVVSLGDRIPLAPVAMPGTLESAQQVRYLGNLYDVILLGNHGVVSCGTDLEQAYLRCELTEHLARMQRNAMLMGSVRFIPADWVPELLNKRKKAGLGPEARKAPPVKSPRALSQLPMNELLPALVQQLKKD